MVLEKKRIKFIDIAKGISMIAIILGHVNSWTVKSIVFTFHVPIFFLITGYFISEKTPLKEFVKKKARTLLVPYAVVCLVIIAIASLKALVKDPSTVPNEFLQWLYASFYGAGNSFTKPFYIKEIGAIWFLLATFFASVMLKISLKMNEKVRPLFIAALFCFGYFTAPLCWLPFSIQAGCCCLLFVYIGFMIKKQKPRIEKVVNEMAIQAKCLITIGAFIVWIIFIITFAGFWVVKCNFGRGAPDILACLCACYCVFIISKLIDDYIPRLGGFLSYVGRYSIILLSVHIIELDVFPWKMVMTHLGIPPSKEVLFLLIVKPILDVFIMYLCTKISFIKKVFAVK